MTSIGLILIIVVLFALLLIYEGTSDNVLTLAKASGLFTWLISGNWPAKVGAALIIIGVGALLRYAFANIDVPPELKLGSGATLAAGLGFAAVLLKGHPKRRAVHLALGGAASGVAYLTAYSAYGFFNYINDVNALVLLALVAIATGLFALASNAMSVAILAMVGAYIAPKFAIGTPSVLSVYGYYLGVSILCLVMVTLRGWRPLIHLSFLFTLAGAIFFGWSGKFYEPENYFVMQPMLLALTVVHLVMPLMERKYLRSTGIVRFDLAYFILLPLVAAGLTLKIAPNLTIEGAIGLGALALIWTIAALVLYALKNTGASRHALFAVLLATAAVLCLNLDLPWLVVGLGISVLALAVAPSLNWPRVIEELSCTIAALFGVLHVIQSIMQAMPPQVFLNEVFVQRIIASVMMLVGARLGKRREMTFSTILEITAVVWAVFSIIAEVLRLHIDFLPQLGYGLVIGAIVLSIVIGKNLAIHPVIGGLLIIALIGIGWRAAYDASLITVVAYLILTPAALLAVAWPARDTTQQGSSDFYPSLAIGLLPFALLPWAISAADLVNVKTDFFEATIVTAGIVVAGGAARYWLSSSSRWNELVQPLHAYAAAFALIWVTLFHIERGLWPVAFEVLALGYLIAYVTRRTREHSWRGIAVGTLMVLPVALVLQAMLLRAFGPGDVVMDASDINKMHLPAVASLMWAVFGGSLAWWGTYNKSRSIWSAGSALLVAAAVKLVFFDFGTLGQLGNIVAFIAAGVVFFAVSWFAPIPPKDESSSPAESVHKPPAESGAPSQPDLAYQEACVAADNEHFDPAQQPSSASFSEVPFRYRDEPKGNNGLWFVVLILAIAIAVFSSTWLKYSRHQDEGRWNHQRSVEAIKKAEQNIGSGNRVQADSTMVAALPRLRFPERRTDAMLFQLPPSSLPSKNLLRGL